MNRIVLAFALLAGSAFAGTASADARESLERFTSGLQGLQGEFVQQVFDGAGQARETSSGQVALSAPRLFRWEYEKPYPQLIIADGSRVWVYDPDLEQVTVRAQGEEEQNNPLAALIDPEMLDRDFVVSEAGGGDGLEWLEVAPRETSDAGFQNARLGFNGNALARMEVIDALGQRTTLEFSGWSRNPSFGAETFQFDPPAGVDVVGDY
ncbi:outer membrane lipoprotein chaperone LolA [Luteimonas dalianensis]|uniref:outer membrane lipoprotein chaperone LolA n=1 Tax=Luteimonas dalianensis TaxID=1148196 RepID=UPI003BF0C93F